ncbi:hypothetical protein PRUPE_2G186700 [Prunus persica]|uniref:Cyclic nucleotide-binding domain-containing protein n=1 Tax=Prunus persica TaxID=3760 RepID=A0A251QHS6_PRUPE|nr:cyclic nucleotide-gated ion channel 1 isoform X2 [Prunus persica]ONI23396.1 hypothetical protein PRUPE_2G186700 [Prunus persica]
MQQSCFFLTWVFSFSCCRNIRAWISALSSSKRTKSGYQNMNSVGHKFVRFEDWHSDRSERSEHEASTSHGLNPRRARPSVNAVFRGLRRGLERGSDRIRSLKKPLSSTSVGNWSARESGSRRKILDPQGSFLQNWNKMVVFFIIPISRPVPRVTKDLLLIVIVAQYGPRLWRIYPLYEEVTRTSGFLTETAWAGAAYNLLLYMLASHVVGAFWYLFSVEREYSCWRKQCHGDDGCKKVLYCDPKYKADSSWIEIKKASCPFIDPDQIKNSTVFNFGIFTDALQSGVLETRDFPKKFLYCFWWGLRNLSSLGQNLKTSTFVWEIVFAVFISIFGLVLFSLLIGNMQKFLQSTTVRVEEMRVKRRDAEQWMSHRMLPENLRERIRCYDQYKWQETRGVDEETLVRNLPKDLRKDIKRHLCLALLNRVPMFEKMDEQLMDALCDRLKPVLYTDKSVITREGDPVDEMLFIMRGYLATMTTNGGRTGFFNTADLKAGDFCGEELLTWALDPNSSTNLPISTRTVEAKTEVEAFALMADDLKFVASQFRRLHSKQLQHTFRFYSLQWRTWSACFIQAAWRRHCKRKLEKSLREAEDRLQDALTREAGSSPSLLATVYASKFAANALRNLRQNGKRDTRPSPTLLPLLPQKPTEPDFTADHRD